MLKRLKPKLLLLPKLVKIRYLLMSISNSQIINYYETTEVDYRLVWNLNQSLALHYGYWDKTTNNFAQALARENEILSQKAKIKSSDKVLDAGCGVGGSSIFLAKKYGCQVIGITLSKKQVSSANQNALRYQVSDKINFIVADFTKTGFNKESFDVVWAIESVCHAKSKKDFLKESFRILKPGGRIIVADAFLTKSLMSIKEKNDMAKWLNGWGVNDLETIANFLRFLKELGFKKITSKNINKNILPSSKRLYRFSFLAFFISKALELLKLRNRIHTNNVLSAYWQYKALKRGLWNYQIFYAEK